MLQNEFDIANINIDGTKPKIEFVNMEDKTQLVDAIIKANKNLKESTEARDWELIGSDMERLQKLIDQLETVTNNEEAKKATSVNE